MVAQGLAVAIFVAMFVLIVMDNFYTGLLVSGFRGCGIRDWN